MKKIYILAACAMIAGTMSARQLTFEMGGVALEPGQTKGFTDIEIDTTIDPEYPDITMDPHLSLLSDVTSNDVTLTATCTSGQKIQVCAGGECVSNTTVTKTNVKVTAGEALATQFEYQDQTGMIAIDKIPVVVTEISAMYGTDASTEVKCVIVMGTKDDVNAASITMIKEDDSLRAVAGGVAYNVNGKSSVALYDLNGRKVMETTVNGEGVINVPSGVYAFTVTGAVNAQGKVYVK